MIDNGFCLVVTMMFFFISILIYGAIQNSKFIEEQRIILDELINSHEWLEKGTPVTINGFENQKYIVTGKKCNASKRECYYVIMNSEFKEKEVPYAAVEEN